MSQPKMTSQKPIPSSSAPQNLSSERYLPRRTPSTSKPPTLTFVMFFAASASRIALVSTLASIGRGYPDGPRCRSARRAGSGAADEVADVDRRVGRDGQATRELVRPIAARREASRVVEASGRQLPLAGRGEGQRTIEKAESAVIRASTDNR